MTLPNLGLKMVSGIIFVAVVGYSASFISFLSIVQLLGFIEKRELSAKKKLVCARVESV
jgi:hypothetical protein